MKSIFRNWLRRDEMFVSVPFNKGGFNYTLKALKGLESLAGVKYSAANPSLKSLGPTSAAGILQSACIKVGNYTHI